MRPADDITRELRACEEILKSEPDHWCRQVAADRLTELQERARQMRGLLDTREAA